MLYIRHAEKAYSNGKSLEFSLDPPLTNKGRESAKVRFQELLAQFGAPSIIISSPYLRTRETAEIAQEVINETTSLTISIEYNPKIGEYLGNHTNKTISKCLRPETLIHKPIYPENWNQYKARVRSFERTLKSPFGKIWYITHGLIIKDIGYFHGHQVDYPKELTGICIDDTGIKTI